MAASYRLVAMVCFLALLVCIRTTNGQLSMNFYARTCPNVEQIVLSVMTDAVRQEPRMGASILRLGFHDCFVQGCDGSILLDNAPGLTSEKDSVSNKNSARGFEVIDAIKARVEIACNATVSCADILALAARDSVSLLGGPKWSVPLGRRDSTTANQTEANNLPSPFENITSLISKFAAKGLNAQELTVLSGSHTVGSSACFAFRTRVWGTEPNINPPFAIARRKNCPASGGDNNLSPLTTPIKYKQVWQPILQEPDDRSRVVTLRPRAVQRRSRWAHRQIREVLRYQWRGICK
ncbi:cationic peroxidase 1-like [Carex rostrata]